MKKALLFALILAVLPVAACSSQKDKATEKTYPDYTIDESATTLTIEGEGKEPVVLTAEDLQSLEQVERTYSCRGKEVENARQFLTYTGVDLDDLLEYAGYDPEGAEIYVICSDGHTREYSVDDLHGLYTFSSNENDEKEEVEPMIAILGADDEQVSEYPCPFKLVYGQADYDSLKSQDFNMQGWLYNLQYMYVSYE